MKHERTETLIFWKNPNLGRYCHSRSATYPPPTYPPNPNPSLSRLVSKSLTFCSGDSHSRWIISSSSWLSMLCCSRSHSRWTSSSCTRSCSFRSRSRRHQPSSNRSVPPPFISLGLFLLLPVVGHALGNALSSRFCCRTLSCSGNRSVSFWRTSAGHCSPSKPRCPASPMVGPGSIVLDHTFVNNSRFQGLHVGHSSSERERPSTHSLN